MSATFAREYSGGLTISVVGHIVLLAVFGMKLIRLPSEMPPQVQLAIEATVIDVAAIRARDEAERERVAEIQRQQQAAAERVRREKAAADAARRKQEQAKVAEQRRREQAERDRKLADQKATDQKAAEKRAADKRAADKRAADQKAAEKKAADARRRQEEEVQRRKAAAAKRQEAERQAQFARELAAEEQRLAAISSGKLDQYLALIINRVERNWVRPASATTGIECVVHVTQIPGGSVVSARIGRCNGDASVQRSIIAAVEKSSPLPPPSDPTLFDRNLRFTFKPEE